MQNDSTTNQKLADVPSTALFDSCIDLSLQLDGRYEFKCKLGLWSVIGHDYDSARQESIHYWRQYYADGEYDGLLSNPRVDGAADEQAKKEQGT